MNIECDGSAITPDGRSLAALRGTTRQELDRLLIRDDDLTGIGRSAFIGAAVGMFEAMNALDKAAFVALAADIEKGLPL